MPNPIVGPGEEYGDYTGMGHLIKPVVDYLERSEEILSRISPARCYLLTWMPTGSIVGKDVPITVSLGQFSDPTTLVLWNGSGAHPDLRAYTNGGLGGITIIVGGNQLARVLDPNDLRQNTEFAVVKRYDIDPQRVEVHFYTSPTGSVVQYSYESMHKDVRETTLNRPIANQFEPHGWEQFKSAVSRFHAANQILVRMPLTTKDVVVNEEGRVVLEDNQCWMVGSPYVRDGYILIVTADQNPLNRELRLEIVNKQDSFAVSRLVSQRFKVKLLAPEDERMFIPYSTVYP